MNNKSRRIAAIAAGASILVATAGYSIVRADLFSVLYERSHAGRVVLPASAGNAEMAHHHVGHQHAGMTRQIGEFDVNGDRVTVFQVGEAQPGGMATIMVDAKGMAQFAELQVSLGNSEERVTVVPIQNQNAHLHLAMPVNDAAPHLHVTIAGQAGPIRPMSFAIIQ